MWMNNELQWRICDAATRKTRRVCKIINVINCENFSLVLADRCVL
jgi:hypothetical protein